MDGISKEYLTTVQSARRTRETAWLTCREKKQTEREHKRRMEEESLENKIDKGERERKREKCRPGPD